MIERVAGNSVERIMAKTIPNKQASTLLPIICENVLSGSVIYTDEHRSYSRLTEEGFMHGTVCHKYNLLAGILMSTLKPWNPLIT